MDWLVIRFKDDCFLFIQHRKERELQLSVMVDSEINIETIVVNKFVLIGDAIKYCGSINSVNDLIDSL